MSFLRCFKAIKFDSRQIHLKKIPIIKIITIKNMIYWKILVKYIYDIRNILLLQQSFNCRKIIIINFFEIYLIMFFYNVIINKLSVTII